MSKTEITNELNRLKNYGYEVRTFNHYKAVGRGTKGFVDHFIIGHYMIFCEVKIDKDKLKPEQIRLAEKISAHSALYKRLHYVNVHTLAEAKKLVDNILAKKL